MNNPARVSRRVLLGGSATFTGVLTAHQVLSPDAAAAEVQATETVQDVQSAIYLAGNNSYGTGHISGSYADCAVVFTAPETGRVMLHWSGIPRIANDNGSAVAYICVEVRSGGTVGSGTVVLRPRDHFSVRVNLSGSQSVRAGTSLLVSGLTPGGTHNARLLHRVTSQSAEFLHRVLIAAPAT